MSHTEIENQNTTVNSPPFQKRSGFEVFIRDTWYFFILIPVLSWAVFYAKIETYEWEEQNYFIALGASELSLYACCLFFLSKLKLKGFWKLIVYITVWNYIIGFSFEFLAELGEKYHVSKNCSAAILSLTVLIGLAQLFIVCRNLFEKKRRNIYADTTWKIILLSFFALCLLLVTAVLIFLVYFILTFTIEIPAFSFQPRC